MFPPLTNDQKEMIRAAKKAANNRIKEQRRRLRKQIQDASEAEKPQLERQLKRLTLVTGYPVVLHDIDRMTEIVVEYETIRKFIRSLPDSTWSKYVRVIPDPLGVMHLVINYTHLMNPFHRGQATFYALYKHHLDALAPEELPIIDIWERV